MVGIIPFRQRVCSSAISRSTSTAVLGPTTQVSKRNCKNVEDERYVDRGIVMRSVLGLWHLGISGTFARVNADDNCQTPEYQGLHRCLLSNTLLLRERSQRFRYILAEGRATKPDVIWLGDTGRSLRRGLGSQDYGSSATWIYCRSMLTRKLLSWSESCGIAPSSKSFY